MPSPAAGPMPAESGHWYEPDGTPAYTVTGANGKTRPTTLRDARKLGLVPSVTTIIRLAAAPGLERWKSEQVLMAALTLPRKDDEPEKDWIARVWADSKEQASKAAERGTAIHASIEKALRGERVDDELRPFSDAAMAVVEEAFPAVQWRPEKSFASPLGYGGKVDLHAPGVVLDFKSKDGDLSGVKCYDEHYMQAAAYARGLGMPDAGTGIVFVTRQLPAKAIIVQHERDETDRGWRQFLALLEFWKAKTGIVTEGQ